jgi:hypothetical protein
VRKLHLQIVVSPRAFAHHFLSPLEISQIKYECDALVPTLLEGRHTDQHGHQAAILPEELSFERL